LTNVIAEDDEDVWTLLLLLLSPRRHRAEQCGASDGRYRNRSAHDQVFASTDIRLLASVVLRTHTVLL
jgi:hypothetical protein